MISAGDIRNGVTFELDVKVLQVVEFKHVKPGKFGVRIEDTCVYREDGIEILTHSPKELIVVPV